MWKHWQIPAPTGQDYRVGWVHEQRQDRYAKVFAPALIIDGQEVVIDWNGSIAWTQMWNWAAYDRSIDLSVQEDRDMISGKMDWSFVDDINEGYTFTVTGNNILSADVDDDGITDWGLGSLTWAYDDPGFFADEPLFCGIRSDAMAFALMYTSENSHGQIVASALGSRGVMEHEIYQNGSLYQLPGIATGANLMAVKGVTSGSDLGALFWSAGFHLNATSGYWEYTGQHKADLVSNSWNYEQGSYLDLTFLTMTWDLVSAPGFAHPDNPGTLFLFSSGNSGAGYLTSSPPATSGAVVSVGSVWSTHSALSETSAGLNAYFGSNGPSLVGLVKPDIVSPGAGVTSSALQNVLLGGQSYKWWHGTSFSCPVVSGAAALILEALSANGMPTDSLTLKQILLSSARDLGYDAFVQGHGMVDLETAIMAIETRSAGHYYFESNESYNNYAQIMNDAWSDWMFMNWAGIHQTSPSHPQDLGSASLFFGNVYPGDSATMTMETKGYDGSVNNLTAFSSVTAWHYVGQGPLTYEIDSYCYDVAGVTHSGFHNLTDVLEASIHNNLMSSPYATLSLRSCPETSNFWIELIDWEDSDGNGVVNHYVDDINFGDQIRVITTDRHDAKALWLRIADIASIDNLFDHTPTLVVHDPDTSGGGSHHLYLEVSIWNRQSSSSMSISDGADNSISFQLNLPTDAEPGIHQGFIEFSDTTSGFLHQVPYSYMAVYNASAQEGVRDTIVDKFGLEYTPYENGAIMSSVSIRSDTRADWGGYLSFAIDVPYTQAEVLVFRTISDSGGSPIDMYLRSTSYHLLASTDDGYSSDDNPDTPLFSPEGTGAGTNTLIYDPGSSVAGKYYLMLAAYDSGYSCIPQQFNLTFVWLAELPQPSPDLTWSSLWDSNPSAVSEHDILVGDHVTVNGSWAMPSVDAVPEYSISQTNLQFASGVYFEHTQDVLVPPYWADVFSMYPIDPDLFSWMYVDGIKEGDEVRIEVSFTNADCDVMVWWADTDSSEWAYSNNLVGNQMATSRNPEVGSFVAERSGTIAVGSFDYSVDDGLWTLVVDTRDFVETSAENDWLTFDTASFGKNTTRDVILVGRNDAGMQFETQWLNITFRNFFAPDVTVVSPNGGETLVGAYTISWAASSLNIDHQFTHDVYISNDYGLTFQLYARGLGTTSYDWDTSIWQEMDSYMVQIRTHDRGMIGEDRSDNVFRAGEVPVVDDTAPEVTGIAEYEYMELETDNIIQWQAYDLHPDYFEIWIDDVLHTAFDWRCSYEVFQSNIDGLEVGTHNVTARAVDQAGNSKTATSTVTVTADLPPIIIGPADLSYVEGTTGHQITWQLSDYNLHGYKILLNGTEIVEGLSDSSSQGIDVSGHTVGVYNYTILVNDTLGQYSSDTVLVGVVNVVEIYSNEDFAIQGWPGSGTAVDPYVIDGLSISHNGIAVRIENVDAFFIIQNSHFSSFGGGGTGIYLVNCRNALIISCEFETRYGIYLWNSYASNISDCVFKSSRYGVYLRESSQCNLNGNDFTGCGVRISGSDESHVDHSFDANVVNGLPLGYFHQTSNLVVDGSSFGQVILAECVNVTVEGGEFQGVAMQILFGSQCSFRDMTITESAVGVALYSSSQCTIQNVGIDGSQYGIEARLCPSLRILDCDVTGSMFPGISIYDSDHSLISANNVSHGNHWGIRVDVSENVTLIGNLVSFNRYKGIWVTSSSNVLADGNEVFSNQESGLWFEDCEQSYVYNNSLYLNSWHGLFVLRCDSMDISNNTVYSNNEHGIAVGDSLSCFIENNLVYDAGGHGIEVWHSDHVRISSNVIYDTVWTGISLYSGWYCNITHNTVYLNQEDGIRVGDSYYFQVSGNTIHGSGWWGIRSYYSEHATLSDNLVYACSENGIGIHDSLHFLVKNCTVLDSGWSSLSLWKVNHTRVEGGNYTDADGWGLAISNSVNVTFFGTYLHNRPSTAMHVGNCWDVKLVEMYIHDAIGLAIHIEDTHDSWIENCTIYDTGYTAVLAQRCNNFRFIGNSVNRSRQAGLILEWCTGAYVAGNAFCCNRWEAISLSDSDMCTLVNNIIENNRRRGILVDSRSEANLLYMNYIGWNGDQNAQDDGFDNQWDDGVSQGNYWSDYDGVGYYSVEGMAASVDRYPTLWTDDVPPSLNEQDDLGFYEGTTGFSITWNATDRHPGSYKVYSDGAVIREGVWFYDILSVTLSLDGYPFGVHNITIVVWDAAGNVARDTVMVDVMDGTIPVLTSPPDMAFGKSESGYVIDWTAEDDHPSNYEIFLDSIVIESGTWTANIQGFSVLLDGLEVGIYNYTLVVIDAGGNSAFNSVMVEVFDDTIPILNHPADVTYEHGETGHSIEWSPSDGDPVSYEVFLDSALLVSGPWNVTGETIVICVDGHTPGAYNYTIVVSDIGGNTAADTVLVTVLDDSTPPVVTSPEDVEFAEGSTGHTLSWKAYDLLPQSYAVFVNDIVMTSGLWSVSGQTITYSLDGLLLGTHNVTLEVVDEGGNAVSDQVNVLVFDGTAPVLDSPSDITYEEGAIGNEIEWAVSDAHPANYSIYRNDIKIESDNWVSGYIIVCVDGLLPGVYYYGIVIADVGGNEASDVVIVTIVDTVKPTIDSPPDIEYEAETLGHSITWTPSDAHPSYYIIHRNGTMVKSGDWSGSQITVSVDRLSPALYNFTITVFDESGNSASDTVWVKVNPTPTDEEPPKIDSPTDIQYEEDMTGNTIQWNPADANPCSYEILRNGSALESGSWSGESISISVDGLSAALYNYCIVVHDTFGNWAQDSVWVNVTPKLVDTVPPTLSSPSDIEYEEESTGHLITWEAYDEYPLSYELLKNGSTIISGAWDGGDISIGVDGLAMGLYNYTLRIVDEGLNSATDTVWVNVTEKFVDSVPPSLGSPSDIEYEEETTGHSITWTANDEYPDQYQIVRNGTLLESGTWDGLDISIGIDGLLPALYNYTVIVLDIGGNSVSDTVFVSVTEKFVDSTPPTIDAPPDIEYEEETTGNGITWTPSDEYPDSYDVIRDGVVIESGSWTGGQISVGIDGLSPGIYVYRLIVYDIAENSASNSVTVTVNEKFVDEIDPTIDSPPDVEYEEDSTGNLITWNPFDDFPAEYKIFRNGTLLHSDSWNGDAVVIGIDGLSPGLYNYTAVVYDTSGNCVSDAVMVHVTERIVDLTPPTLTQPDDLCYELGTPSNSIQWDVSDENPGQYTIYRNGAIVKTGSWQSSSVGLGVDGLLEGVYNCTIEVFDSFGNSAVDTVFVTVDPSIAPTINDIEEILYEEDETGNKLRWTPSDAHPDFYEIFRDGTLIKTGVWYGFGIEISVDGLSPDTYNYTILVYDSAGNFAVDSAYVVVTTKVSDWTPPTVDSPNDVIYEEGLLCGWIEWHPDDLHPHSYRVLRNGSIVQSGTWDGSSIRIGVGGLPVGSYNYTLIVTDSYSNWACDSVMVIVNDAEIDVTPPWIEPHENVTYTEGNLGNSIYWIIWESNPHSYEIKRDSAIIRSGVWDGSNISVNIDMLAADIYYYQLTVEDTSGNVSNSTVEVNVIPQGTGTEQDESSPSPSAGPTISHPEDFSYEENSKGHSILWSAGSLDPLSYAIYRNGLLLEGGIWAGDDIGTDVDGLAPGLYEFTLVVTESGGTSASDSVFVTVETSTPPSVTGPSFLQFEYGESGHSISWSVSDAYPATYLITCDGSAIDSGMWSTGTLSVDIDELSAGSYEYVITLYDASGNSAAETVSVIVEEPCAPLLDSPPDLNYDEGTTGHLIVWNPSDSYPSHYVVKRNGSVLESASWSGMRIEYAVDGMPPGFYVYSLTVYDLAGHSSSDAVNVKVFEVIIDESPPLLVGPDDIYFEEGSLGHIVTWEASDDHPTCYEMWHDDIHVESGSWDGSDFVVDVSAYIAGTHNLTLLLLDISGNLAFDTVLVHVSVATPPDVDHPTDVTYEEGALGNSITWNAADSYPDSYKIYRNESLVRSGDWTGGSISIVVDGLSAGNYVYSISVLDLSGNSASDSVLVFVLEPIAPSCSSPDNLTFEEGMIGFVITWYATDNYPDSFTIKKNGSHVKSGLWSTDAITISLDGLSAGVYEYIITVKDEAGHQASDIVYVDVIPGVSPQVQPQPDVSLEQGTSGRYIIWEPSDLYPDRYVITRNGSIVRSGSWTGDTIQVALSGLAAGKYPYRLKVYDMAGNSASDDVVVLVDSSNAPLLDSPADIQYEIGSEGHIISWSPFDSYPNSYVISRDGNAISSGGWTGGSISIQVDALQAGMYEYVLTVKDQAGNTASDTVTVIVEPSSPPSIDCPPDITYEYGTSGNRIVWAPRDRYPASYKVLRNGTLIVSGGWSGQNVSIGVDGLPVGNYSYQLVVTDKSGNSAEDTVLVIVEEPSVILPELNVVVSAQTEHISAGQDILYTISCMNIAGGNATRVVLRLNISDLLIFVNSTHSYSINGTQMVFLLGEIASYTTENLGIVFQVSLLASNGTQLWVNATLHYFDVTGTSEFFSTDASLVTVLTDIPTNTVQKAMWWKKQFHWVVIGKQAEYSEEYLLDLVLAIASSSDVFSHVTSIKDALAVLKLETTKGVRGLAMRELYGVWLNLANDALTSDTNVDLGDLSTAGTVGEVILECEAILLDQDATLEDLRRVMKICSSVNSGTA